MSPAKLLGLPQTDDSIIVRQGRSFRMLPRAFPNDRSAAEDGDARLSRKALCSLLAVRKIGEKK